MDDLHDVKPTTEDPYQDFDFVNKRIDKAAEVDKFHRSLFEREWFRNILFYIGQHWIIYDGGRWRAKRLPGWYPRTQTNKFAEKENDLVATLAQIGRIPIRYTPSRQDPDDIATAEVGERVREVLYEEAKIDDKRFEMAHWLGLTGNVFLITSYDTDESHGTTPMGMLKCTQCGSTVSALEVDKQGGCPGCLEQGITPQGGAPPEGQFEPALDEEGAEITEDVPIGALDTDVCSPFEIRVDHRITKFTDQERFVRVKRYDLDFARHKWNGIERPDGTTIEIQPDANSDLSQFYLDILSHATSNFSGSGGAMGADQGMGKRERVTAYMLYEKPSEHFPKGLQALRIGTTSQGIVYAKELPSEYGAGVRKGQKFLPAVHFGFDKAPGRLWFKTRMDDVVPLQLFRNVVEANLKLTAQRMGNPVWLNPKGSGVESVTGEPGQWVTYNPISLGGTSFAKPERMEASLGNIQPMILLLNKIDDAIERVSGTFFLQGGDTPPGVTAASALSYLGERAARSMSPLTREWALGWKRWEEQALELARANWTDDRINVVAGRNRQWEAQVFKQADLAGSVKMDIDYNGLMPKSNATDRAEVGQLIQFQVINPQDPQQNYNILKLFGKTELLGTVDLDTREATKENEQFMEPETIPGPDGNPIPNPKHKEPRLLPLIQNSQIHIAIHSDLCKIDEWKNLDEGKQQRWLAHIMQHQQDALQYQQFMQAMTMKAGDAGPQGPGSQAAAAQNGGVPNGTTSPDARLNPDGSAKEMPTPDMAGPPSGADAGIPDVMSPAEKAA